MGRTGKWIFATLVTVGLVLVGMQNCSQVAFEDLQKQVENRKISIENEFVVGNEPVQLAAESTSDSSRTGFVEGEWDNTGAGNESGSGFVEGEWDNIGDGSEGGRLVCGALRVKDVIIDILAIEVKTESGQIYQLDIGSGPADLLDLANGIDFIPQRNLRIDQLRVLLGNENYVLTIDESIFPLKSTSQESAGLIVQLEGRTDLARDVTYHLTMDFDPRFQIKQSGNQCALHPNVSARIE